MGARLMQKGLPAECSVFGSTFMTAWLAARSEAQVPCREPLAQQLTMAPYSSPRFSPYSYPRCRSPVWAGGGCPMGGAHSPGPPSRLRRAGTHGRKAEGAGEKRHRGTWVSELRTLFFLPAKPSFLADIPSRDEPWF